MQADQPPEPRRDAIVDLRQGADAWLAMLLGVRVVVRALLSLQRAGFEKAYLIGDAGEEALRHYRKHSFAKMPVEVVTSEPAMTTDRRLVFRAPVVAPHTTLGALSERAGTRVVEVPLACPEGFPGFLVPARDAAERAVANRTIRRAIRKPMLQSGIASVYVLQPIGLQICRVLCRTPLTPNHLTILGFVFGVAALPLLWTGGQTEFAIAAILLFVNNVFDQLDGEIARMKVQMSPFGDRLDHFLDEVFKVVVLPAMGMGLYHQTGQVAWMIIGWTAGSGRLIYTIMMHYYLARFGGPDATTTNFRFWYRTPRDGSPPPPPRPGDDHAFHWRYLLRKDFTSTAYFVFGLVNFLEAPFLLTAFGSLEYGALAIIQLTFFHRRFGFQTYYKGNG